MNQKEIKFITLGNSKVGKSSYILRYTENQFSIHISSTVGIDYKFKNEIIDGESIKVYIFDTSGQERFRSISYNMLKNANGVLLFFDITDRESFTSITEWFESIYQHQPKNFPIVLIGNKIDKNDERQITKKEAEEEANKHNLKYFEISCKNNINIREPILDLISKVSGEKNEEIVIRLKPPRKKKRGNCCKKGK